MIQKGAIVSANNPNNLSASFTRKISSKSFWEVESVEGDRLCLVGVRGDAPVQEFGLSEGYFFRREDNDEVVEVSFQEMMEQQGGLD